LTLLFVEFAYNNNVNGSTGKSPFEVVHGYSLRTLVDLIPPPPNARVSQLASTFAQHIHVEIRRKIALSNDTYKLSADVHRRAVNFAMGDFVMARIQLESFLKNSLNKLYACAMGPLPDRSTIGIECVCT